MPEEHETRTLYSWLFYSKFHFEFLAYMYHTDIFYLFEMKIKDIYVQNTKN
jgi:hypothetical protein